MLDLLKRRLSAAVGGYEWNGETVHFKRLSAGDFIAVKSLATPEADTDEKAGVEFYVQLLSVTLCTPQGVCECNSDEGRNTLQQLSLSDLQSLGQLSLKHSGLVNSEKN